MKKFSISVIFSIGVLALSGCSFALPFGEEKESPLTKQGSIWKSIDGGASFDPKINLDVPLVESSSEKGTDKKAIKPPTITEADILTITFHPNDSNTVYVGTVEDGIFKTTNGGESWKSIKFPPQKIDSFILDRNDPDKRMLAAGVLYEVGKIFRTEDGGENWKEAYSEPGSGTLVTSLSQHGADTNVIFAGTSGGTVIKSTDSGQTWKNIGQKIDGPVTELPFDATLKFSVYALSFNRSMRYSEDGGAKWIDWEAEKKAELQALVKKEQKLRSEKRLDEAERLKKTIAALRQKNTEEKTPSGIVSLVTSQFISGTLYAGTQRGQLYKSLDYGKYWKQINIIESASAFPIRMAAISYANKNELAFIAGEAFYKSLNGGESWAVTQLDVDRPVSVIVYDPQNSNVIYLGLSKVHK